MRKPVIKKGDNYNRLTAIRFNCKIKTNQYWLFRCDCGNEKVIAVNKVKSGTTKSCGCLRKEGNQFKHGMRKTITYNSWISMKRRCLEKTYCGYKYWGGRGITICPEWLGKNGFENFYKDMGKRPIGKTIDRKDNDGN